MQTLDFGDTATLTITRILGPNQTVGTDVITFSAEIDSSNTFDPYQGNNSAVQTTSVLGDPDKEVIFEDSFEDP